MNRRNFLAATLASLALPSFASAFGGDPTGLTEVSAAYKRAAATGRKLLVFVVPEDDGEKYTRGTVLGEFLNHGPTASLARLGEVELLAASMDELRALVPAAPKGEPLFVLVDPSAIPSAALGLTTPYATMPPSRGWLDQAGQKKEDGIITRRIEALALLIDTNLPAAASEAHALTRFKNAMRNPIPGSHWSVTSGCGSYIEDAEDQMMPDCGMGHVNARSARMLYFYEV